MGKNRRVTDKGMKQWVLTVAGGSPGLKLVEPVPFLVAVKWKHICWKFHRHLATRALEVN